MEVVVEGMRAKKSNKIFGFFGGGGKKNQTRFVGWERGQKNKVLIFGFPSQPNFLNYNLWFSFQCDFVALKSLQKSLLLTL